MNDKAQRVSHNRQIGEDAGRAEQGVSFASDDFHFPEAPYGVL